MSVPFHNTNMSLFSFFVSKESKTRTLVEKLRKQWGTKKFRKSTPTKVIDAIAEMANLRSRAPRVAEFSDFFLAATSYVSSGEQDANFKLSNFASELSDLLLARRSRSDPNVTAEDVSISVTAIINRLKKDEVPEFLHLVLDVFALLLEYRRQKYSYTRVTDTICKLCGVSDVHTIDGTYIEVRKSDKYECRAGNNKAGIAIHGVTSLKHGSLVGLEVTQGACNERLYIPTQHLSNTLLLADRGYPSYEIMYEAWERGEDHNLKFLFRVVPDFKAEVLKAVNADGKEIQLATFKAKKDNSDVDISDKANHVLDVTLKFSPKKKGNKDMILRGVRIYRPHDNSWSYFITNISADQLVAASCGYVYKLRWVCEQLYKCAKSYTSLVRGINSTYLNVVLFFIVASICTMILRTIMAAYMRLPNGKYLSMLKVHQRLRHLIYLFASIAMADSLLSFFRLLRVYARSKERQCILSQPSTRDQRRAAVFSEVFKRICRLQHLEASSVCNG